MNPSSCSSLASPSSSIEVLKIISATPLATMDPEVSSHQEEAVASQDTRSRTIESSQGAYSAIPESSGGSWSPCNLSEETLSLMEQEGLVVAKVIS
jgi:hypothetical protein